MNDELNTQRVRAIMHEAEELSAFMRKVQRRQRMIITSLIGIALAVGYLMLHLHM